jgi:hypothetical protein
MGHLSIHVNATSRINAHATTRTGVLNLNLTQVDHPNEVFDTFGRLVGDTLREPKKNDLSVLATDKGPVLFPKLYRRFKAVLARWRTKSSIIRSARRVSTARVSFRASGKLLQRHWPAFD